jgi:acyl-CoA oxidase
VLGLASTGQTGMGLPQEYGGGGDVALGTVATHDVAARGFVITTPDEESRKDYIGNAARHADVAVVFAQLQPGSATDSSEERAGEGGTGVLRGVHAFRVPRTALLNEVADVTPTGVSSGHEEQLL